LDHDRTVKQIGVSLYSAACVAVLFRGAVAAVSDAGLSPEGVAPAFESAVPALWAELFFLRRQRRRLFLAGAAVSVVISAVVSAAGVSWSSATASMSLLGANPKKDPGKSLGGRFLIFSS
jgi:ABC-type amino acid transport system permease subunit